MSFPDAMELLIFFPVQDAKKTDFEEKEYKYYIEHVSKRIYCMTP